MALLPDFFKDCVVALGSKIERDGKEEKFYTGTGFLVGDCINPEEQDATKKMYSIYLITNKHVVDGEERMIVKFNSKDSSNTKDYEIDLIEKDGTKLYSCGDIDDADIVAISINPNILINDNSTFGFFSLDAHALTVKQMQEQKIAEGDFVYTLGFPMNLVSSEKNVPICRMGCIAYISKILKYEIPELNFYIDSQTFPGNSGGPVIIKPEAISIEGTKNIPRAALIGILHSYIPYEETCISLQTKKITHINSENSGLTLVHPVDLIIMAVKNEQMRIESKNKKK